MKLILKTLVSSPAEIPFLWMMFGEARHFVDQIIVCEFDRTHSGLKRDMFFDQHVDQFQAAFPQLTYLQGTNLPGLVHDATTPEQHHLNETWMRGWFASQVPLGERDIIVSTDSDEVLYGSTYKWIQDHFTWRSRGVRFRLHHFVYRPNYLWVDKEFVAPVALRFGSFNRERYPNDWRYQGRKLPGFWGCHFSWCLPIDQMVQKVKNYSHAAEQNHVDKPEDYIDARNKKIWPFDGRDFRLTEISYNAPIFPDSFWRYKHLLDPDVIGDP